MKSTIILPCNCKHEFQDEVYGRGMRLHNVSQKKDEKRKAYCTVCSPRQPKIKQTTQINQALGMVTYEKVDPPRQFKELR